MTPLLQNTQLVRLSPSRAELSAFHSHSVSDATVGIYSSIWPSHTEMIPRTLPIPSNMQYDGRRSPLPVSPHPEPKVLDRRAKPQCFDHGCNGREFSTFSNLLRHQREKSGSAAKSYCPNCGAEFTRTTARNGHMEQGKCKPRRASDS